MILGLLLSTQFRSLAEQRAQVPTRRLEELTNLLKESEEKRLKLEQEISSLRIKLNSKTPVISDIETLNIKVAAGILPVQGEGIKLIIDDSNNPLNKGENPANAIIHSEDLLKIINELKSSGAEAISVNKQRLISTSEITCAGPVIIINQTRLSAPFEINAIGNPDLMINSLKIRGGIIEYLQFFGIRITITKESNIVIPAYNGTLKFKYVKPLTNN